MGNVGGTEESPDGFAAAEPNKDITSASHILIGVQIALAILLGVCAEIT